MKTMLKQANALLLKGQYDEALRKYEQIQRDDNELANLVHFNIKMIDKRLKHWSKAQESVIEVSQTGAEKKNTLEKPKDLEQYVFDKILESDLFDVEWYLSEFKEKQGIKDNPLAHYLAYGVHQRLNPSQGFDTCYYIESNPDVAAADMNPFLHYVLQGRAEGRQSVRLQEPAFESYPTVDEAKYIPRLDSDADPVSKAVRVIAFYLPQFHPVPENDEWWGKGFTEWTNVKPAKSQFEGHYQPHVPDDFIGHYNLLDRTVFSKQIELAKQYGIEGFCFYLYWFSGKRLLEQPVDNYLKDPALNLPFCVCWANENWSRRWDGLENDLLMVQNYSDQDDLDFIANIARYLCDPRYIRIHGKPLLLIYRPNLFPDMKATAGLWREWCQSNGVGEIYLAYPQSFECVDPAIYGFDAAVEFPPNNSSPPNITSQVKPAVDDFQSTIYDWRVFIGRSENYQDPGYKLFRGACPSWDNTARKKNKGTVFHNNCPKLFSRWLINAFADTLNRFDQPDEQIVFVNAWNEWAEGAHLEPDQKYGYAWLQAVRDAHKNVTQGSAKHPELIEIRWNKIKKLFKGMPDKKEYGFLNDYIHLLQRGKRQGYDYQLTNGIPFCQLNGESISIDSRSALSIISKKLYRSGTYCFVVLQYNRSDLTIACVNSILKLEKNALDVKVIIVDNNSEPSNILSIKQEFGDVSDVVLLLLRENKGFSGGNNIGFRYARDQLKANFCVVLNNDTVINQTDFISESIKLYDKYSYSLLGPDVLIGDGRHENPWNDYIYSIDEFETLYKLRNIERSRYIKGVPPSFKKIGKVTATSKILLNPLLQGAAYVVSPIFIDNHADLFDERLFLYGEEFLLTTECLINGDLCIYSKNLVVEHREGASTALLPTNQKMMLGYDSAIKSIKLCLARLERKREASHAITINHSEHDVIRDIVLAGGGRHVLVDLLFCQPGYHGGGEYGKAVFKKLAEEYAECGGFELWAALNPELFIDPWVWDFCRNYGINAVAVTSYDDIISLVNADIFHSFFTPAIVVYTGYEYMKKVGERLPFICKGTRVIGTLHDIRDFELAREYEKILIVRKNAGCVYENGLPADEWAHCVDEKIKLSEQLKAMYKNIICDAHVQIVTVSKYCENSINKNIGIPAKPFKVWMPPMKPRVCSVKPAEDFFGVGDSEFALMLHAGRFEKNAASVVRVFDMLITENVITKNFKIILTGITSLDALNLSEIVNISNFITPGELHPEALEYCIENCKFLVYPSFNEGFGYPPIEAMSCGVQVVASNITAIPEVCGQAAIYVDPFNLISIREGIINAFCMNSDVDVLHDRYTQISIKQAVDLLNLVQFIINAD